MDKPSEMIILDSNMICPGDKLCTGSNLDLALIVFLYFATKDRVCCWKTKPIKDFLQEIEKGDNFLNSCCHGNIFSLCHDDFNFRLKFTLPSYWSSGKHNNVPKGHHRIFLNQQSGGERLFSVNSSQMRPTPHFYLETVCFGQICYTLLLGL